MAGVLATLDRQQRNDSPASSDLPETSYGSMLWLDVSLGHVSATPYFQ